MLPWHEFALGAPFRTEACAVSPASTSGSPYTSTASPDVGIVGNLRIATNQYEGQEIRACCCAALAVIFCYAAISYAQSPLSSRHVCSSYGLRCCHVNDIQGEAAAAQRHT